MSILTSWWLPLVLSVIGIAIIVYAAKRPQRIATRGRADEQPSKVLALMGDAQSTESRTEELQRLAETDLRHMESRVLVIAVMHSTAVREQEKPFLEFTFSVFNGCVFPVRIDTRTEGRVKGNAIPLDLSPDVLNTAGYNDPVQHGHVHILKMRQYLSDQEATELCTARKEEWEKVPFDFTGLTVWIYPQIPDGKRKRLALNSPVLIPQRELFL